MVYQKYNKIIIYQNFLNLTPSKNAIFFDFMDREKTTEHKC